MSLWAIPVTVLALLQPVAPAECRELQAAHRAMQEASFSVERRLTITVNGELKVREVARLTWDGSDLTTERLEFEHLDKNIVFEEDGSDPILDLRLECDSIEVMGDGHYRLRVKQGAEDQELDLRRSSPGGALVPIAWRSREKVRFLWKKMRIEAVAVYENFALSDSK